MKEFKDILKERGIKGKDFAKDIGLSHSAYRSALSRKTPTWVKAFLLGFKMGKQSKTKDNGLRKTKTGFN